MKFKMPEKPKISRRLVTWLVFAITVPLILAGFVLSAFYVQHVRSFRLVGETRYACEELQAVSGIEMGERLFSIDGASAEKAIKDKFPRLKSVRVRPVWFSTVIIEVEEEKAKYYSNISGSYYLLSEDFRVIEMAESDYEFAKEAVKLSFNEKDISKAVEGKHIEYVSEKAEEKMLSFIEEIEGMNFGEHGVSAFGFESGGTQMDAYIILDGRLKIVFGGIDGIPKKTEKALGLVAGRDKDFEFAEILIYNIEEVSFREVDSLE